MNSLSRMLAAGLPICVGKCILALAPEPALSSLPDGALKALLQISIHDDDGELIDVKEQTLQLAGPNSIANVPRVERYLQGWLKALPALIADSDSAVLMPHDLVFVEALGEIGLDTVDEFCASFAHGSNWQRKWIAAREHQDFLDALQAHSLMQYADQLCALRRPSLRLYTTPTHDVPIGQSRLGGLPDLPSTMVWPCWNQQAYDFIGQINLHDLHQSSPDQSMGLPTVGMLYFFYALSMYGGTQGNEQRGGGRVLYFAGVVNELHAATLPANLAPLAARTITFRAQNATLPPCESPYYPVLLGGGDNYADALSRAADTFGPLATELPLGGEDGDNDRPRHRVGGYADPLQHSANINCEGYSSGLDPAKWGDDPLFWQQAADWQLLLQTDSEYGDPDVMLGDAGLLYFLIRPADLVAQRFDLVWTDWQSH
jgi:uncharacterized protein YwqG